MDEEVLRILNSPEGNSDWIKHVLKKLRKRYLNGELVPVPGSMGGMKREWVFDSEPKYGEHEKSRQRGLEHRALLSLVSSGVIALELEKRGFSFRKEKEPRASKAFITSFDYKVFKEVCEQYDIKLTNSKNDPHHHLSLYFHAYDTPAIKTDNETFFYKPMRNGNAYALITHCLNNHPNKTLKLDELKRDIALSGVTNVNEALRKSIFDTKDGLLRKFVEASPKSLKVLSEIHTTSNYYSELKNEAIEQKKSE